MFRKTLTDIFLWIDMSNSCHRQSKTACHSRMMLQLIYYICYRLTYRHDIYTHFQLLWSHFVGGSCETAEDRLTWPPDFCRSRASPRYLCVTFPATPAHPGLKNPVRRIGGLNLVLLPRSFQQIRLPTRELFSGSFEQLNLSSWNFVRIQTCISQKDVGRNKRGLIKAPWLLLAVSWTPRHLRAI